MKDPGKIDGTIGARDLAQAAGGSVAAQIEVADLASLGRDVLEQTGASSADAARLKVTAALSALAELGPLRAAEAARAAADERNVRVARLQRAVTEQHLPRSWFFDVGEDAEGREKLTPKAAWMIGTLGDLDAQLRSMGTGAAPKREIPGTEEALLAERAKAAGMSADEYRASEARVMGTEVR